MVEFFQPTHPLDFTLADVGIDPAQVITTLDILKKAKDSKRLIIVFGDYDADGISATAILWQTLNQAGFDAKPFIPHREKHGYGISMAAIDDLEEQGWLKEKPLVITVDTGIVAHQGVAELVKRGAEVIITDHHVAEDDLPAAEAVVHSTHLCGATVSWMLSREIASEFEMELSEWWQLDLAGLATIADQVPLQEANRAFAWWGIKALQNTERLGLVALLKQADVKAVDIDETTINYVLAPRINAMGRLAHGLEALRLLCTTNPNRAYLLAEKINDLNAQRQKLTDDLVRIALSQQIEWRDEPLIVVASPAYHEGVIGLVAGKLSEQFHKPAIVIAVGEQKAKASARSVAGINIIEFLRRHRELFTELGGHPMAAGFGCWAKQVPELTAELLKAAKKEFQVEAPDAVVADCVLPRELLNLETVKALESFRPFGQRNPRPMFVVSDLELQQSSVIGKQQQHLKLQVTVQDQVFEILMWSQAELQTTLEIGRLYSFLVQLDQQTWRQKISLKVTAVSLTDVEKQ